MSFTNQDRDIVYCQQAQAQGLFISNSKIPNVPSRVGGFLHYRLEHFFQGVAFEEPPQMGLVLDKIRDLRSALGF